MKRTTLLAIDAALRAWPTLCPAILAADLGAPEDLMRARRAQHGRAPLTTKGPSR